MKRKIIVFIPARGGSKGIPLKNIKKFLGEPLIVHSINYAKDSKKVDKIILSTDHEEIQKIAEKNNIEVLKRPKSISNDIATTESAIEHFIYKYNLDKKTICVLLQPTSPLRPKNSLDKILKTFIENKYDSMLTLSPIHPLAWKINNQLIPMYDYKNRPRRQDFQNEDLIYDENGSVYIFTLDSFFKNNNRLGGKIGYYIFDEEYGKQIDTPLDFKILETIGKFINEE
tara:strand:+ start:599 stop:1282 length:684 start_codon:yes stop_codon:yes gene_type:complete